MNRLEVEFKGKATVISLDTAVPANTQLQVDYGLRGHPSIAILGSDGKITLRFFGPATADNLRLALAAVIDGG